MCAKGKAKKNPKHQRMCIYHVIITYRRNRTRFKIEWLFEHIESNGTIS